LEFATYPEHSIKGIIQRNYFILPPEEIAKKTETKLTTIRSLIARMIKEGEIPAKSEIVKEYLKSLKPKEKTRKEVMRTLHISYNTMTEKAKSVGTQFKLRPGYAEREPFYLKYYGKLSQREMARRLGISDTLVSYEMIKAGKKIGKRYKRKSAPAPGYEKRKPTYQRFYGIMSQAELSRLLKVNPRIVSVEIKRYKGERRKTK